MALGLLFENKLNFGLTLVVQIVVRLASRWPGGKTVASDVVVVSLLAGLNWQLLLHKSSLFIY